MPAVSDSVWSAQDTTPGQMEAALRGLLAERHHENDSFVPARVISLVCVVDREWSGEIANRLRNVGRSHPSRTIVCSVEPGRHKLDAVVTVASDAEPKPGSFTPMRETVIISLGPEHLEHIDTIVDPLVITDLPTAVWSPHGHPEAVDAMRRLAQVVLLDSIDEPDMADALTRAKSLSDELYVVDLAWLRGLPWRERIAGTFDPPVWRSHLRQISKLDIRHHPDSGVAGLLLCGWLASRLGWRPNKLIARDGALSGKLSGRHADVQVRIEPAPQEVRGLVGLTIETAAGMTLSLDRGPGGLNAVRRTRRGPEQRWTLSGASRGEGGILGEGIRQALARNPTYAPALAAAAAMVA
jgi:glucose-6-phosphate dehydrogenase assembly protein OpcA